MPDMLIKDQDVSRAMIRERKRLRLDRYDEVWDGVYVMPSMPTNLHQRIVQGVGLAISPCVMSELDGQVLPGANISDNPTKWKRNYRIPDLVVVLPGSKAVVRDTHFFGGPDFIIEIKTPGDDTEEKLPFYEKVAVRELLVVHRDTRSLRLYRHDGVSLTLVAPTILQGSSWLVSAVLPFALRRIKRKGRYLTEIIRPDGKPGKWVV